MRTAAENRQRAAAALAKEAAVEDHALRAQWLELARVWITLAEFADAQDALARAMGLDRPG
jgi:hypothetical protein